MNLPNKLTLSRFFMTVLFLAALVMDFPAHESVALAVFLVASFTDWLDGSIARSRGLITDFGKLMDPLADKILVCSAFIAFIELGWVSSWMVIVIVARELAITGLRLLAASKNLVLAAEGFGKHKTVTQIVAIVALLVLEAYPQWGVAGGIFAFEVAGRSWVGWLAPISLWLAVLLTILSGFMYLWKNRNIYLEEV